jgi:hypothetical protein
MIQLHVVQGPDSEYHAEETDSQKVIAHRQPLDKMYMGLPFAHRKFTLHIFSPPYH